MNKLTWYGLVTLGLETGGQGGGAEAGRELRVQGPGGVKLPWHNS